MAEHDGHTIDVGPVTVGEPAGERLRPRSLRAIRREAKNSAAALLRAEVGTDGDLWTDTEGWSDAELWEFAREIERIAERIQR